MRQQGKSKQLAKHVPSPGSHLLILTVVAWPHHHLSFRAYNACTITTVMLPSRVNSTPTDSHSNSSLRGLLKSSSRGISGSFLPAVWFLVGSGLPRGPNWGVGVVSLSLRAVLTLRTVNAIK